MADRLVLLYIVLRSMVWALVLPLLFILSSNDWNRPNSLPADTINGSFRISAKSFISG
jgi:hypothetical protein